MEQQLISEKFFPVELTAAQANLPLMEMEYFHLGDKPDVDVCNIRLHIAEEPQVIDYISLCNQQNIPITPQMGLLRERFDIWLINQSVGISDNSGNCSVSEMSYSVNYDDGARIEEMMPDTTYIQKNASGRFIFTTDLDISGNAKTANLSLPSNPIANASTKASISATTAGNLSIRYTTSVLTPIITAHGRYSKYGEWTIKKADKDIVGDQIFSQIIFTEKNLKKIKFNAKVSAVIRRFGFLNSRRESQPVEITLKLVKGSVETPIEASN